MHRQAFFLGLFATGSQTLVLRELVSTLNGSELFIGTALFGWLVWVGLGAYLGGRFQFPFHTNTIFAASAIALPFLIVLCRLSPLLVTDTIGELIPFSVASLISIVVTLPHGLLSGILFPAIVRQRQADGDSVLRVYLVEGLGACAAGAGVTLIAGHWLSTLSTAVVLALAVILGTLLQIRNWRVSVISGTAALVAVVLLLGSAGRLERSMDQVRYPGYEVITSLETPYTHQTILRRDSSIVLMTDNTVESTYPDVETAENLLLPALAYWPQAKGVIILGRAEFGPAQLAAQVGNFRVDAVDLRAGLAKILDSILPCAHEIHRLDCDPASFGQQLNKSVLPPEFVALNLGDLGSFRTDRYIASGVLRDLHLQFSNNGMFVLLAHYDTDRYLTPIVSDIVGTIYRELASQFAYVTIWPGTRTLFLASDSNRFDITRDTLFTRLSRMKYQPQYIHEMYLHDRLNEFKTGRLTELFVNSFDQHTVDRPTLVVKQSLHRARANRVDRFIAAALFEHRWWLAAIPVGLVVLALSALIHRDRARSVGLLFYVVAGLVSLTVELLILYLYQSYHGSLVTALAALIGTFMFGLSLGTYWGVGRSTPVAERVSLLLFISVIGVALYNRLGLHGPFLMMFATAFATGGLFVAATRRYYTGQSGTNSGLGYALEISGSAVGALLTTTVLLPIIGLTWILVSCLLLLGLAGLVSFIAKPSS